MKFETYPDREMMMIDLANQLAEDLENSLINRGRASFVVPGGTTPGPIFDSLCGAAIDWSSVHVMLSDERWVPETSERSNTALIRARLLSDKAAAAHYIPLYTPTDTPEAGIPEIEPLISEQLPISVLLLGMGADMHTASIFPGADKLAEAQAPDAPILVPMRAPGAPEPRVTLSARVLADAVTTHIVITGDEKREALERARALHQSEAPIVAFLNGATVHWAA